MSKRLSKIFMVLAITLLFPFALLLTGCGATPVNSVNAVYFESNLYDEETGYAVFEVDLNVETELTFKINPSVWEGYEPVYAVVRGGEKEENRSRFRLEYGKITVLNPKFEEITVRIYVNEFEDTCIIRLKEYPTDIFLTEDTKVKESTDYVNAGGVYTLHVYGQYTVPKVDEEGNVVKDGKGDIVTENVIRELGDDRYNFLVESSDKTVIDVLDNSRLKVCSLKHKIESATVTISLLDTTGKVRGETFVLKLKLNVVLSPNSSIVTMDGFGEFVEKGGEANIDLTTANLETETTHGSLYYKIGYTIELFDISGVYINAEEYTTTCVSNQQSFIVVDNENQIIKVRKPSGTDTLSAEIKISTSANMATGESYMMNFTINFKFPESD